MDTDSPCLYLQLQKACSPQSLLVKTCLIIILFHFPTFPLLKTIRISDSCNGSNDLKFERSQKMAAARFKPPMFQADAKTTRRNRSHRLFNSFVENFFQILIMRLAGSSQAPALISSADLTPFAEPLLHGLFGAFELQSSAENEYVMKCIMRSFSTLQVAKCVSYWNVFFSLACFKTA